MLLDIQRKGRGVTMVVHGRTKIEEFNLFIDNTKLMELMDIPLNGRIFTWFRPNGQSMSRLDSFLISHDWTLH